MQLYKQLQIFTFLLLLTSSQIVLASVTASVDRNSISEADTFRLTIRADKTSYSVQPNFDPLSVDFEVLGTSRSSEMRSINGVTETSMEWIITLSPKKIGRVTIPAIDIGSEKSDPIELTVTKLSQADVNQINQSVFFNTSVNKTSVYVQEQFIYTVQLFYADSVQLYGVFPPEPQLDNAIVKSIGGSTPFQTVKNGIRYGAIERKYLIFPQNSGELIIPGETISGNIQERLRSNAYPASRKGIKVGSEPITLQVKPKPASYPANLPWLPAESLTVSETWSNNPPKFTVGEPINRTVAIRAIGIDVALLPELTFPKLSNLRLYPDPAKIDESISNRGIVSSRTETMALVPIQPGQLTLPERRIVWWNVKEDRLQETKLAAQNYTVMGNPEMQGSNATTGYQAPSINNTSAASVPSNSTDTLINKPSTPWFWIILSGISALGWATTLHFYWKIKNTTANQPTSAARNNNNTINQADINKAVKHLEVCCSENDSLRTKEALIGLGKCLWPESKIPMTISQFANLSGQQDLKQTIFQLEKSLYSKSGNPFSWQGGNDLIQSVKRLIDDRNQINADNKKPNVLPPLYPSQ